MTRMNRGGQVRKRARRLSAGTTYLLAGLLGVVVVLDGLLLWSATAGATTPDPTGGGATQLMDGLTGWMTGYGVPLIVGVLGVTLILVVLLKYAERSIGGRNDDFNPRSH